MLLNTESAPGRSAEQARPFKGRSIMFWRRSFGVKVLLVCLAFPAFVSADDLLYASDGKQLFTVDLQTGATTFVSDGPLQWLASPTFDEKHHTRLWVKP